MLTAHQLTNIHTDTYICTYTDIDSNYYPYYSVCQDPGKKYKSKLHKNTHPVTVVLKETHCYLIQ